MISYTSHCVCCIYRVDNQSIKPCDGGLVHDVITILLEVVERAVIIQSVSEVALH